MSTYEDEDVVCIALPPVCQFGISLLGVDKVEMPKTIEANIALSNIGRHGGESATNSTGGRKTMESTA
jgi:hypothetical protein